MDLKHARCSVNCDSVSVSSMQWFEILCLFLRRSVQCGREFGENFIYEKSNIKISDNSGCFRINLNPIDFYET